MRKVILLMMLLGGVAQAANTDLENRISLRLQQRIQKKACDIQIAERRIPFACHGRLDLAALEAHCLSAVSAARTSFEIDHRPEKLAAMPEACRKRIEDKLQDLLYKERKSLNKLHSPANLMNN